MNHDLINRGFPRSGAWIDYFAALVQNTLDDCLIRSKTNNDLKGFVDNVKSVDKKKWKKWLYNPVTVNWCSTHAGNGAISASQVGSLLENLDHRSHPVAIAGSPVNILSIPPPVIIQNLRSFGVGSKGPDSSNADHIKDLIEFYEYINKIIGAVDLIKKYVPGFYKDFCTFVTSIVLVDGKASFRGASSIGNIGLVFFSPDKQWSEITWADEIVHETTHNLLDVVSVRDPILLGKSSFIEKYDAPFRKDKRHLYGNFHALCVISRLIQFHTCLVKAGVNKKKSRDKIEEYQERAKEPYRTLLSDADFSELGKLLHEMIIVGTLI